MCNFFWHLCFCCHSRLFSYSESIFCGSVNCNINYIFPRLSTKYCYECIQKECNLKKVFCVLFQLPEKIIVDKKMNGLTIFTGPTGIKGERT